MHNVKSWLRQKRFRGRGTVRPRHAPQLVVLQHPPHLIQAAIKGVHHARGEVPCDRQLARSAVGDRQPPLPDDKALPQRVTAALPSCID